jgi:hypothetical protein
MFAMAYMGRKRRATRISCYAALTNDHVCGPGWPGPHEVHQRHQTRQEIRAKPTIAFVISTGRMLQRQEKQSKHIVFGPRTLGRTWGTRLVPIGFCYEVDSATPTLQRSSAPLNGLTALIHMLMWGGRRD